MESLKPNAPRISLGLPVYNGERYLSRALDSILAQDHEDFELIISDNASTDATEEICRQYAARDRRIRYLRSGNNNGAAWNFNLVFQLSRGKFFRWCTHDDECAPQLLRRCLEVLENAPPQVILCYPKTRLIDQEGRTLIPAYQDRMDIRGKRPYQRLAAFIGNVNLCNAIHGLIRAERLRRTRLFDSFIGSDYVLLAELCILGELWEIPEVLFYRRIHSGSSRQANPTPEQLARWFNPRTGHGLLRPRLKVALECLKSIDRASLSPEVKALCWTWFLARWSYRRARVRGGELKILVKRWLSLGKVPTTTPNPY